MVAAIAWSRLDHSTKLEIARILMSGDTVERTSPSGHEYTLSFHVKAPQGLINDAFLEGRVRSVFIRAATWPDAIKGGKSSLFDSKIDSLNDATPEVTMASGNEKVRCKTWHYMDLPIKAADDPSDHTPIKANADYALKLARENLANLESSRDSQNQALWLYFIEHIVGDLHQPLHCCSSFVINRAKGDAGGNLFKLDQGELHAFWDSGVNHAEKADTRIATGTKVADVATLWLSDSADQPAAGDYEDLTPMDWISKGRDLAVANVYDGIHPGDAPSDAYVARQSALCKKQVLLAGYRLAEILNQDLKHS